MYRMALDNFFVVKCHGYDFSAYWHKREINIIMLTQILR